MDIHQKKKVAATFFRTVKDFLSVWRCFFHLSPPACPSLFPFIWPTSALHHQGLWFKPAAVCKAYGSKCLQAVCGNTDMVVLPPRVALASSLVSPFPTSSKASLDPLLILCSRWVRSDKHSSAFRDLIDSRGRVLLKVHSWIIFTHIKVMAVSTIHHVKRWKRQSVRTELR